MRDAKLNLLSEVPLLGRLRLSDLRDLAKIFEFSRVGPGTLLQVEGDRCRWWTMVADGVAAVCREDTPIGMLGPGDSWDVRSIVKKEPCGFSVTALSDMTLFVTDARGLGYVAVRLGLFEEGRASGLTGSGELVAQLAL